jgi:hypothetical protein
MDETMLPDVWSMPVAGATKNLAALISFVLGGPGRFGRIYDSRQPHRRAVWVQDEPPPDWDGLTWTASEAGKNLGPVIDSALSVPPRPVRIGRPPRAVWVTGEAPEGWEDDSLRLHELHHRICSDSHRAGAA